MWRGVVMDNYSSPDSSYTADTSDPNLSSGDYFSARYSDGHGRFRRGSTFYVARARQMLLTRISLAKVMPRNLFRDSAWDVMLELYIGTAQNIDVYVKQAIIASGECPATAMRIIARLEKSGFLIRKGDESDQRRVVVSLSEKGMMAMELLFDNMTVGEAGPESRHHHPPIFPLS